MKPHEIKELRKQKKLTQEDFGNLCGVTKTSISKWEKGITSPSGGSLKTLERLLSGELVITELSDLEIKLLDENVRAGHFQSRENYLTASLKHLLVHGSFLPIFPASLAAVAEDEATYNPRVAEEKEKTRDGGEANTAAT